MMSEIQGNKAIEDAAIAWVVELERRAGRDPSDTRYRGAPADIASPPRLIEVKAFGTTNRGYDLWLEVRQVEEARRNPNFYVYVVENVRQGNPAEFTLKVLGGEPLARLLRRAKERRYFTLPWPVADYDSAPTSLGHEPMRRPAGEEAQQVPDDPPDTAGDLEQMRASGSVGSGGSASAVVEFRGDDGRYLAWLAAHAGGWVVNANKHPRSTYLQLHKASCPTVSHPRRAGAYTERQYIKFCAQRKQDLDAHFETLLGTRPRWSCTQCR
jgi:Domain of unknown function (DUF3883)